MQRLRDSMLLNGLLGSLFLIQLVTVTQISSKTILDVNNLYNDLFSDYRSQVSPVADSQPIEIGLKFYLLAINSFDEVQETLTIVGVLSMNWTDPLLSWNPSSYGNKSTLEVPSTQIWLPWMYLTNTAMKFEPIGSDSLFRVLISSNGGVIYLPGDVLEVKCSTDVTRFPYDSQICILQFDPWSAKAYTFTALSDEIHLDFFTKNSNWKIESTHTYTASYNTSYYMYDAKIVLKRESTYHTVIIILPTTLLCLMNPLVFLLPVESGERISLAMTILLSYAIFLTLVSDSIPASSNPMCVLLIIMVVMIILSGLTVIGAIITSYYYYKNFYEPSRIAKFLLNLALRGRKSSIYPCDVRKESETSVPGKDISEILDKIFFVSFCTFICVVLGTYFIFVNTSDTQ